MTDPPASLELAMDFMSVSGPNDFFPPLGFLSWVLGAGSVVLCWRVKVARWWILFSLAMIVCEGVASMLYFWPRNEIMSVESRRNETWLSITLETVCRTRREAAVPDNYHRARVPPLSVC